MIDLKPACSRLTELLASVRDDHLTLPTPCAEYTVADLIAHVDEVARGFTALAGYETPDATADAAPDPGSEKWRRAVAERVHTLGTAWRNPAAWEGRTAGPGVELPNAVWGRIALTEMVVHGWDLARATGARFGLPEETLQACLDHVSVFVPDAPLPELWGTAVEVPADAPLIDRIVAVTGRQP